MTLRAPFRVVTSTHPVESCQPCQTAADSATSHASVMGSTGATWNDVRGDVVQHSVEVTRLSEEEHAAQAAAFAAAQAQRPQVGRLRPIRVPARKTSPAEDARREADETGNRLVEALAAVLPVMDPEVAKELDRLLAQLRADEYEAGFQTGHAAGLAVGERNARRK